VIVAGEPVVQWVCSVNGGGSYRHAIGLGLQNESAVLTAGCVLESWNGSNVMMHIRLDKPPTRKFWDTLFDYAFVTLGCARATAVVDEANEKCLRLVKRLNFKLEARLALAGRNACDALVFTLWKQNRRHFGRNLT
jgi:hypothetical protein